ncbi:ATP-binding cassette domain-containing protein [Roseobacter sp. N2S]|uniref:ATP-binding cassette domain-containing protein n=1 Tax=Roseobacter sp. N2S TaxID=2663844 RepID=UPI0028558166|nr:ATP-binding cassette domain-containing protein [Roseobacter sp. N2S]MDR6264106.1 tungstate transport system ATP-binding protein [Roseobacter sp. N2S]
MISLQLKTATLSFEGKNRLGPLSLAHQISGITAVLGPNGAGKSLFLALCHGILSPQTGSVCWDGQPARATRDSRGFMLQTPVVLRRTVAANIDFALQSRGMARGLRRDTVASALSLARLGDRANTPAATLSGGELRRMSFARALVTQPKALLLDEPFAGLDPAASQAMEVMILHAAQTTPILMSNHDLVQTRRIASQVLFFSKGQLLEHSQTASFFAAPDSDAAKAYLKSQLL